MERFIARKEEISRISSALSSDHFELVLVYGRLHVGKSELIRHCLNQKDFLAVLASESIGKDGRNNCQPPHDGL